MVGRGMGTNRQRRLLVVVLLVVLLVLLLVVLLVVLLVLVRCPMSLP